MKKKDLEYITSLNDSNIKYCRIIKQEENSITFEVDEDLEIASEHMYWRNSNEIIQELLEEEQIPESIADVVACSFTGKKLADIGSDVLYKTILACYGEHRPLVLSPDMIWIVINQTLAKHINENAEKFGSKVVDHEGKMDIVVETEEDIFHGKPNWSAIFDEFYTKIDKNVKDDIASRFVADFSTTGANERIASIVTLMHGVQSYFRYTLCHCICGIPYITLEGNKEDWKRLLEKAALLKDFGLRTWYSWLTPILKEFIKTSEGKANMTFWKNMVRIKKPTFFTIHSGCSPDYIPVDGWCAALFPYKDEERNGRIRYDESFNLQRMASETLRVDFKYVLLCPNGTRITTPMELWSGMVGVEENPDTFALRPHIGWFIRKSDVDKESLERLREADKYGAIDLTIDEIPEIFKKLDNLSHVEFNFNGDIKIPEWMFAKKIETLIVNGKINKEYKVLLQTKFPNIVINGKRKRS